MNCSNFKNTSNLVYLDTQHENAGGQNPSEQAITDGEKLDILISNYYRQKSIEQDTTNLDFSEEKNITSEEFSFKIMMKQAKSPRQILLKLNILENELTDYIDCGAVLEPRILIMFAGLKADLIGLIALAEQC